MATASELHCNNSSKTQSYTYFLIHDSVFTFQMRVCVTHDILCRTVNPEFLELG
jgi:hypothetical protein